ncbi:zinc finger CCCH-type with G patch domain-containing protein-like [Glandiceps talaboti]
MDEESLEASLATHRQQLSQVEAVLQSAGTDGQEELVQLKDDLTVLVQLTEASLLSYKKSKLLSMVDNYEASSSGTQSTSATPFDFFQGSNQSTSQQTETDQVDNEDDEDEEVEDEDEDEEDDDDDDTLDELIGTKCRVPYTPGWGTVHYHNAVILCVETVADSDDEQSQVRVLFCNPTDRSMLPCPYFLDGKCKFDENCRFSHGYIVNVEDIEPFKEPDFSLLENGCKCLALQDGGIWQKGKIETADSEAQLYSVHISLTNQIVTLGLDAIVPVESTDDDSDDEETHQYEDDDQEESESIDTEWKPSGASRVLGDWEAHTKGFGSKMMAKMGYKIGEGLGKTSQGRLEPVEAEVLPAGKSLDICAELKQKKKLGILNVMKKKRKAKRLGTKTYEKKSHNVFDFLNKKLGGKHEISLSKNTVQKDRNRSDYGNDGGGGSQPRNRNLNIQLMKTHQDMRSLERELSRLKKSRDRNIGKDRAMTAHVDGKIAAAEQHISSLKEKEKKLQKEQHTRKEERKLRIF